MKLSDEINALGITDEMLLRKKLRRCYEPKDMVSVEGKLAHKSYMLEPNAAASWSLMKQDALNGGILIYAISTYRSPAYQAEIIRRKLDKGMTIEEILKMSAPPGFSEHHSGKAIDIGTQGFKDLDDSFENSEAFIWLTQHAIKYGFSMSFPRENMYGYGYEPWHWLHKI